jgi:hypothetical protein
MLRLLPIAAAALACASGDPQALSASERADALALDEAETLCSAHVDLGPRDEEMRDRRLAFETWRLSSGAVSLDETGGNLARIDSEVHGDCLDQVLPALSGSNGAEAVSVLGAARRSCERDGIPPASSALAQCIHARKLEVFAARAHADSPETRETLDRLLRVGGGAPLSPEQRASYCRTRELTGTGHPFCD